MLGIGVKSSRCVAKLPALWRAPPFQPTDAFLQTSLPISCTVSYSTPQVGDVVEGTVISVKPYGAFVDIGGASGLLHISQISHDRIANVEKVLSEGDRIKVRGSTNSF